MTAAASAALRAVAAAGIALELNTAGLRKPVGEAYPAPGLLAEARALGIPLTFGSDAHRPQEVGVGVRPGRRDGAGGRLRRHLAPRRRPPGAALMLPTWAGISWRSTTRTRAAAPTSRDLPLIIDALRGLGYDVDERETQGVGDATRLAREAVEQGLDLVCAIGGDGTVNETINGLAGTEVPLAIVPTGTVNVLAMELGIPLDPPDAVKLLEVGTVSWIDLGLAGDRYFGLMAGVGMDAAVVASLNPVMKKAFKEAAFAMQGVANYLTKEEPLIRVTSRGAHCRGVLRGVRQLVQLRRRLRHHAAGRHARRAAGRLRAQGQVVPEHHLVLDRRADQRAHQAPQGRVLPHRRRPRSSRSSEGKEVLVQTDGEVAGRLPLTCRVVPRSLRVVVP